MDGIWDDINRECAERREAAVDRVVAETGTEMDREAIGIIWRAIDSTEQKDLGYDAVSETAGLIRDLSGFTVRAKEKERRVCVIGEDRLSREAETVRREFFRDGWRVVGRDEMDSAELLVCVTDGETLTEDDQTRMDLFHAAGKLVELRDVGRVKDEWIDHERAAMELLGRAERCEDAAAASVLAVCAQTHATLALAEQERMGNRILLSRGGSPVRVDGGNKDVTVPLFEVDEGTARAYLPEDVARALRIDGT